MRFVRALHAGQPYFAEVVDDGTLSLLTGPPWAGGGSTDRLVPRSRCRLLAPVTPSKIVCVGRNYRAHAAELDNAVPSAPLLFLKPPSSLIGAGDAIELPEASARVEHEAEVGVVVGSRLRDASEAEAAEGVFGLTCVNDVTARDLQRADVQFTRGKGFDTFCPCGPEVVTGVAFESLEIRCEVNAERRQQGDTRDMVFPIPTLLSYMSRIMTLEPGDLVATGTPAGVGPLCVGDSVAVEIAHLGRLENPVRARQP